ncbi:cytochrome c biogenesis protein CcdA [Schaalia sp. 19OD2882]|nr:cytochrome c biogenesis protein CcdA [Schaalia sp. 19OD2882]
MSLPAALLAGVLAFASPCFLPLVPALLVHLAGVRSADTMQVPSPLRTVGALPATGFIDPAAVRTRVRQEPAGAMADSADGRWVALCNALAFVAAFSVVFVGLWALAAAAGNVLGALREPLRVVGGVLLLIMGLQATGLIRMGFLDRVLAGMGKLDGTRRGVVASAALGLAFALGWSPCIGPVLGAIIAMALAAETAWQGLALMVVFCAGLGLPLVLLAAGLDRGGRLLTWMRGRRRALHILSGLFLLVIGFLMVTDLLGPLSGTAWFGT